MEGSKAALEFVAVGGKLTTPLCLLVNGGGNCHRLGECQAELQTRGRYFCPCTYRDVILFSQSSTACFYSIHREGGKLLIRIRPDWYRYIYNNQLIMKDWIKYQIILYLQERNPNVPAIPLKIEPQREE